MTIQHLEYMVALSSTLNFTKAAAYLHITQPALSRIISSVEQELGFAVFDRSRRTIQLTPAGQTFVKAAHKSLEHYYIGVKHGLSSPSEHIRPLVVGYIADAFNSDLRDLVVKFKDTYPDFLISLEETRYYDVFDGLQSEDRDLVFYTANVDNLPSDIAHDSLEPYGLYVALYPDHPLANRQSLHPLELASESFVELCYHKTYSKSWNTLQYIAKTAGFIPTVIHQCSTVSSVILQVQTQQGIAIATHPTKVHWGEIPDSGVVFVPLEEVSHMERVMLWSRENQHPALPLLIDHIKKYYKDPSVTHYQY